MSDVLEVCVMSSSGVPLHSRLGKNICGILLAHLANKGLAGLAQHGVSFGIGYE